MGIRVEDRVEEWKCLLLSRMTIDNDTYDAWLVKCVKRYPLYCDVLALAARPSTYPQYCALLLSRRE